MRSVVSWRIASEDQRELDGTMGKEQPAAWEMTDEDGRPTAEALEQHNRRLRQSKADFEAKGLSLPPQWEDADEDGRPTRLK